MRILSRLVMGVATVSLLFLAGCEKERVEVREVVRPVKFVRVYLSKGGSTVRAFSGTAKAGRESRLSFKVSGTLETVGVTIGDRVKKGKLIAKLSSDDFDLKIQEVQASLDQANAKLRSAKADYERIRALYENNSVSKQDLDVARAGAESAKASVVAVEKQVELAKSQMTYTRLSSPLAGVVSAVEAEANENVSPGQTIAVLVSGEKPEVTVAVPETYIVGVKKGSAVEVVIDSIPGERFNAKVTEVGVTASAAATAYQVTVKLDKPDIRVRPGMTAEVLFEFKETTDSNLIIPSISVGEDTQGRYVFVMEPAGNGFGVVKRVEVETGKLTASGLEILSGLSDGDRVVTAGISKITEGQKVQLSSEAEDGQ